MSKKDYQKINPNFNEELVQKWKNQGFTYKQTKQWVEIGLTPEDSDLASLLNKDGYSPEKITPDKIEEIIQIYRISNSWESTISTSNTEKEIDPQLKEVLIREIKKNASKASFKAFITPDIPDSNSIIVITNWIKHAVRLINYEKNEEGKITIISNQRFPNSDWKSGYGQEEAQEKAAELKWKLETDYLLKISQRQNNELKKQSDELKKELSKSQKEISCLEEKVDILQEEIEQLQIKDRVRNILLIGRTGRGKSTLANVLSNNQVFEEGKYGTSETHDIQTAEFEDEGVKYRVIDTVGIGDTQLTEKEVLDKIADAAYSIKEGLNQVLFVTSGRFDDAEIFVYELLIKTIFDQNIGQFTTIIKTNFPYFQDQKICIEDKKKLEKENTKLFTLTKQINEIIHVDNAVIDITNLEERTVNQIKRQNSREKLLLHLANCQKVYKPQNLQNLNSRIGISMREKQILEQQIKNLNKLGSNSQEIKEKINDLQCQFSSLKANIREETNHHVENRWANWITIGSEVGGMLVSLVAVITSLACSIM